MQNPAVATGYDRSHFGLAWADTDGNGCDTRNDILARDLTQVVMEPGSTNNCVVASGVLVDPYTAKTLILANSQMPATTLTLTTL